MKRLILLSFVLLFVGVCYAEKKAEIKFDKEVHNFGSFPEENPEVTCVFTFTNIGNAPLIINRAMATCGCTVPVFTEEPVMPGKTGTVKVTYNGKGKFPGHFKKTITILSNANTNMYRLYIEGDMVAAKKKK